MKEDNIFEEYELKEKLGENGFEKDKIHNIPTFTYVDKNAKENIGNYALYYGRISPEKGVEYAIKAYEKFDEAQEQKK